MASRRTDPWPHVKLPLGEMKDADPQIGPDAAFLRAWLCEVISCNEDPLRFTATKLSLALLRSLVK